MKNIFFVFLFILLIAGCVSKTNSIGNDVVYTANLKNEKADIDKLETDIMNLSRSLATRFYDYKNKPIIKVYIAPISSNFDKVQEVGSYIDSQLKKYFNKKSQYKILNPIEGKVDVFIQGHIEKIDNNNFSLNLKCVDPKNGKSVYTKNTIYNEKDILTENYNDFISTIVTIAKKSQSIGQTRLQVGYISSGESYKEDDKYYLYTVRNLFSSETMLLKKDTGNSGFYPGNIQITIDGILIGNSLSNILYDEFIYPGRHEVVVSFSETVWDAYNQNQIRGKVVSKKVFIDISKNDFIRVDILCAYDGTNSNIIVKADKRKEVLSGGRITENLVPIQIFQ